MVGLHLSGLPHIASQAHPHGNNSSELEPLTLIIPARVNETTARHWLDSILASIDIDHTDIELQSDLDN